MTDNTTTSAKLAKTFGPIDARVRAEIEFFDLVGVQRIRGKIAFDGPGEPPVVEFTAHGADIERLTYALRHLVELAETAVTL